MGLEAQAPIGVTAQADVSHADNKGFRQGDVPADVKVGSCTPVLSRSWIPREAVPYLVFLHLHPTKGTSEYFS